MCNISNELFIAHRKKSGETQLLFDHLYEVSEITAGLATKLSVPNAGRLIGLLHDLGKYSSDFQTYLGSATGKIHPDADDYIDFTSLKGKIDHSTSGAQWIWDNCQNWGKQGQLVGQILAVCIASHHGGMIDSLRPDGNNGFIRRMGKQLDKTHKTECLSNVSTQYMEGLNTLLDTHLITDVFKQLHKVIQIDQEQLPIAIRTFNLGFWTRMLFSCLVDADRINSADFEFPENAKHRSLLTVDWSIPVDRIENYIGNFKKLKPIDELRCDISKTCQKRAIEKQGIYTLTVPTGGGKTISSLRYALHHAQHHQLDRIVYIIPYTSIIEQNADALRKAIEDSNDEFPWILEQHSNLEPEQQNWHSKLVSENWDAPIIMTTMVQFLEILFSGGTRGVRKVHQLVNSVLIFDEIQTLPIKCTHLFCNALNFLTNYCGATSVLCTATQPLLDDLKSPAKGQLNIPKQNELITNVPQLFDDLKRVDISNKVRPEAWTAAQISELALNEFTKLSSCLVIVNTKDWAKKLYHLMQYDVEESALFQLSTNLCPSHRKVILRDVRKRLKDKLPVLCISTQLIEAGVDVDFASVIRFLAGLDSIAQAAGRCNRNGLQKTATVHVINPVSENIDLLTDIKIGQEKTRRILDEGFNDLLAPEAIRRYFKYYFYDRSDEMTYPVSAKQLGRADTLLNLLSHNPSNIGQDEHSILLQQSFKTAGKLFKAIDSPTQAVIVQYSVEGRHLVAELCRVAKEFDVKTYRQLLKQAQKFSVNVFPNTWRRLMESGAIHEIHQGEGIYFLDEQFYSDKFGLSDTPCRLMSTFDL